MNRNYLISSGPPQTLREQTYNTQTGCFSCLSAGNGEEVDIAIVYCLGK